MTIDMHAHWMPPVLADALRARKEPPRIVSGPSGGERLEQIRGSVPLDEYFADADNRIALMDEMGVTRSVLSLSGVYGVERLPLVQSMPLAKAFNDGLSQERSTGPIESCLDRMEHVLAWLGPTGRSPTLQSLTRRKH